MTHVPDEPQRRRRFIPFPIVLPGCLGCGFVSTMVLLAAVAGLGVLSSTGDGVEALPEGADTRTVLVVDE